MDQAAVIAAQAVAPLAADGQELDGLAGVVEIADAAACLAQDRGVEAAGETAVGAGDDDQLHVVAAGAGEQRRRPGHSGHASGQRAEHALHALRIGPRRLGLLLGAAQARGGDHLHRRGDFLRRAHAADAVPQILQAGHGSAHESRKRAGEIVEEGGQPLLGCVGDLALGADRVEQFGAAGRADRRASAARSGRRRRPGCGRDSRGCRRRSRRPAPRPAPARIAAASAARSAASRAPGGAASRRRDRRRIARTPPSRDTARVRA